MKIETVIKRVKKYYPKAKSFKEYGEYYIGIPDITDDSIINLFEEYLIESTNTEEEAWNKALICCRTTQNFNRTHPDRLILSYKEDSFTNVNRRQKVSKTGQNEIQKEP